MAAWGENIRRVLELLSDLGPLTRLEIEEELGLKHDSAKMVMTHLRTAGKQKARRVRITDWRKEPMVDGRGSWKAVYALGNSDDAPRPVLPKDRPDRIRAGDLRRARSIFDLASSTRSAAAQRRGVGV